MRSLKLGRGPGAKSLKRRAVLRGLLASGAAVTIPLPLLNSMLNSNGTAYAQGEPLPTSYVTWFFGNGVLPGVWVPSATGTNWELSPQLAPLASVKEQLTVVSGLANPVNSQAPHPDGSAVSMTGAGIANSTVQLMSIDQIVADKIGNDTPFKSLEVGVTPATPNGPETTLHSVSHRGPNAALRPEFDPGVVFNRLFSDPVDTGPDANLLALTEVRQSVLDSISTDISQVSALVGSEDKARLEQHLEGIRSLEMRLQSQGAVATCAVPSEPSVGSDTRSEAPRAVNTAMAELATMALACDRTRVVSFVFTLPAAHVYYRHLAADMDDDFHDTICHGDAGDQSSQARVNTGVLYTMECLNEFLQKMTAVSQGAGTLLDNSLVYVTSCTAWGKTHTTSEWPVLFAGKAGGRLAGNLHHRTQNGILSQALLSIANIMGVGLSEIGKDVGYVNTELSGLTI